MSYKALDYLVFASLFAFRTILPLVLSILQSLQGTLIGLRAYRCRPQCFEVSTTLFPSYLLFVYRDLQGQDRIPVMEHTLHYTLPFWLYHASEFYFYFCDYIMSLSSH